MTSDYEPFDRAAIDRARARLSDLRCKGEDDDVFYAQEKWLNVLVRDFGYFELQFEKKREEHRFLGHLLQEVEMETNSLSSAIDALNEEFDAVKIMMGSQFEYGGPGHRKTNKVIITRSRVHTEWLGKVQRCLGLQTALEQLDSQLLPLHTHLVELLTSVRATGTSVSSCSSFAANGVWAFVAEHCTKVDRGALRCACRATSAMPRREKKEKE